MKRSAGRDAPARVTAPHLSPRAHSGATCGRLRHAPAPASPGRNPRGRPRWTARPPVNPRRAAAPSGPPEEAATQRGDDRTEAEPALQMMPARAGATQGLQKSARAPPPRSCHSALLQSKVALKPSLLD